RSLTERSHYSITRTETKHLRPLRSSRKSQKPTRSCPMTRSENSTTSSGERESTRNITPRIFSEGRTSIPYSETWVSAHSGEVSAASWNESSADSEGSRTSKAQAARPVARTWFTVYRLASTRSRMERRER